MTVDVLSEIVMQRPREEVARYASNPDHTPAWYVNIQTVEWKTPPPVTAGAQVAFVAHFLGRRMAYTYEIVELVPGERMVMGTAQVPFPMETTYTWHSTPDGGTRMAARQGTWIDAKSSAASLINSCSPAIRRSVSYHAKMCSSDANPGGCSQSSSLRRWSTRVRVNEFVMPHPQRYAKQMSCRQRNGIPPPVRLDSDDSPWAF